MAYCLLYRTRDNIENEVLKNLSAAIKKGFGIKGKLRSKAMTTVSTKNAVQELSDEFVNAEIKGKATLFANKIGLIGKLFGCGHGELSRPFSQGKIGYRSCLKCGAVKRFNPETLETFGGFYYPSVIKGTKI